MNLKKIENRYKIKICSKNQIESTRLLKIQQTTQLFAFIYQHNNLKKKKKKTSKKLISLL